MKKYRIIFWAIVALLIAAIFSVPILTADACVIPQQEQTETQTRGNADMTRVQSSAWDTTALDHWCGEPIGKVRMVGAWFYNYEPSNQTYVLEDETGELWVVRDVGESIGEDDFLLLWIDNNATPDYLEDDVVVKVWSEVHA